MHIVAELKRLVKPISNTAKHSIVYKATQTQIHQTPHHYPTSKALPEKPIRISQTGGLSRIQQKKMNKGDLPIELEIDLHGMNREQAYITFINAIRHAYHNQQRLVLCITGKGRNSIESSGVLRHELPKWLDLPEIASKIIRVCPASKQHGGDGAFYVILKKKKASS